MADQIVSLAKKSHDILQLRTIIFFNRTTSNLDGTISYVHESNTTFERVTAKPLDRKSCSSLRSRGVFPLRCSNAQYHQTTGAVKSHPRAHISNLILYIYRIHGRPQKFFQGVNVDILLIIFRLLTFQCKWKFTNCLLFLHDKENASRKHAFHSHTF